MPITVRRDDLSSPLVHELIAEHLSGMHQHSPPGQVHALAVDTLKAPDISFWSAWLDGELCGMGAMKRLHEHAGEIKSMRTRSAFVRRGVGQAVLEAIIAAAQAQGYSHLYLETGTGEAFSAAHALYLRNGFQWCGPFGPYTASRFNAFMVKLMEPESGTEGTSA